MTRKSVAEAAEMSGKTARACNSCISKRARWYCAADDAFLCQICDASVHSANSLARRHHRALLQTSYSENSSVASWRQGFTRKARTPRQGKTAPAPARYPFSQVPEEETSLDETEERLLHRVPVLGMERKDGSADLVGEKEKENQNGYLSYALDIAEFSADVECLLGNTLGNECFDMEELGLPKEDYTLNRDEVVKIERGGILEDSAPAVVEGEMDLMREPFELNFDDFDEEDEKVVVGVMAVVKNGEFKMEASEIGNNERKALLSLDREAVVIAWGSRGTPWTSGHRPNFDVDYYSPDCMGTWWNEYYRPSGEIGGEMSRQPAVGGEGERKARVSRYREKRRTRLFAKKIRYEVRKLNAEKRPRMKGRFVKRSSGFANFAAV